MEMLENELSEEDIIEPTPIWVKVLRALVALIALVGVLYLSGAYQYLLFQRTSPSIVQVPLASEINEELIAVPLTILIATSDDGIGSIRTGEDVSILVKNASSIWQQAQVSLHIEEVIDLPVTQDDLIFFAEKPHEFLKTSSQINPNTIKVLLVPSLNGINGIAFGGTDTVAVADYTTVHDFRTLAHEVGHVFGLPHVSTLGSRLMYRGANGTKLSLEEIEIARSEARSFLNR